MIQDSFRGIDSERFKIIYWDWMCFVGLKNNALEYYARSKSERSVVYATLHFTTGVENPYFYGPWTDICVPVARWLDNILGDQ